MERKHTHTVQHHIFQPHKTTVLQSINTLLLGVRVPVQISSGPRRGIDSSEARIVSMATDHSSIPPLVESEMKGFMWRKEKKDGEKRSERERERKREDFRNERIYLMRGEGDERRRWQDRENKKGKKRGEIEEEWEWMVWNQCRGF